MPTILEIETFSENKYIFAHPLLNLIESVMDLCKGIFISDTIGQYNVYISQKALLDFWMFLLTLGVPL